MPTYRTGNMWNIFDKIDHFVITTNSVIKSNGAVVMGAGIAKQVRDRFPGIDVEIGKAIQEHKLREFYGCIIGKKIGIFQVKYHYKHRALPELIHNSARMLAEHARANPDRTYALNYPGIGNGKLTVHDVEPHLRQLPANVQVWSFN